jgi:hypothetical protein
MSLEHTPARQRVRTRFGRIPRALEYCGLSRSRLYELGAEHPGLFRKQGRSTLIDFSVLDEILDTLPAADLKAPPPRA